MFVQSKKSVLYIATLSALALMSGVASAATTGTITNKEGVNGLGLDGSQTNDISWSNENGTGFEPTSSLQIVGNKNDVTLSAKDVLKVTGAQNADNKVVAFYGMPWLVLSMQCSLIQAIPRPFWVATVLRAMIISKHLRLRAVTKGMLFT